MSGTVPVIPCVWYSPCDTLLDVWYIPCDTLPDVWVQSLWYSARCLIQSLWYSARCLATVPVIHCQMSGTASAASAAPPPPPPPPHITFDRVPSLSGRKRVSRRVLTTMTPPPVFTINTARQARSEGGGVQRLSESRPQV